MNIDNLTKEEFCKCFEGTWSHATLLYWTEEDIKRGLEEARKYNVRTYIGPNEYIPYAKKALADTDILIEGTWSFPFGNIPTSQKIEQLEYIMDLGADTCDGCLNMQYIKNHRWDEVEAEVKAIMEFAKTKYPNVEIKMITEFGHLTDEEILTIAGILDKYNVICKCGTGWRENGPYGSTSPRKVRMIKKHYPNLVIKGVGGADTSLAAIMEFLEAGVSIIGSSQVPRLLEQWDDYFNFRNKGVY